MSTRAYQFWSILITI